LLTDKELEELGVKTIGDRAVLRKRCREAEQDSLLFSAVLFYIGIIKVWVSSTSIVNLKTALYLLQIT